jgi:hypothetical protein
LYWSPDSKTSSLGKQQLDFYAGDLTGKYVVVVQGITKDGNPGATSFTFTINERDSY